MGQIKIKYACRNASESDIDIDYVFFDFIAAVMTTSFFSVRGMPHACCCQCIRTKTAV